jgi:GT2 family glycosyltransferase
VTVAIESSLPLVAVVVLTWNDRDLALACLASLREQTYNHMQVIVVDNASTDGTADAVAAQFPEAELLRNSRNLLFAGGNNVGIARALELGADWVILLNHDTWVDSDFIAALVGASEERPDAGALGPLIYYAAEPRRIWYAGGLVSLRWGRFAHRGIRQLDRGEFTRVEETEYVTGCALMMRNRALREIGLLDEGYQMYCEDTDWCLRARQNGWKLYFVPQSRVWHHISVSSGGQFAWRKIRRRLASQLRLCARHSPRWALWSSVPAALLIDAGRVAGLVLGSHVRRLTARSSRSKEG